MRSFSLPILPASIQPSGFDRLAIAEIVRRRLESVKRQEGLEHFLGDARVVERDGRWGNFEPLFH